MVLAVVSSVPFDGVLHVYNWSWRIMGISCRGAVGDFPSLVVNKWSIVLLLCGFSFCVPEEKSTVFITFVTFVSSSVFLFL